MSLVKDENKIIDALSDFYTKYENFQSFNIDDNIEKAYESLDDILKQLDSNFNINISEQ